MTPPWLRSVGVYFGMVEAPARRVDPAQRDRDWATRSTWRIARSSLGAALVEGVLIAAVWLQFSSGHHPRPALRLGAVCAAVLFVTFVLADVLRRRRARRRLAGA